MKKLIFIFLCLPFLSNGQGKGFPEAPQLALTLLKNMQEGDTSAMWKSMSPTMQEQLNPADLITVWEQMTGLFGSLMKTGTPEIKPADTLTAIWIPLTMEKARFSLRVAFSNRTHLVEGCFIVPADPGAGYKEPGYVDHGKFFETKIKISVDGYELQGKLAVPNGQGPFPVLVLFAGSGLTHDEDETIFANKPFRDLAWGLASMGIAVARFPKRYHDYPDSITYVSPQSEYLTDAKAWLEVIKSKPYIDPKQVFILGHSQGGMMAPEIARENPWIKGIVIMAGNARPIPVLIQEQMTYLVPDSLGPESMLMRDKMIRQAQLAMSPQLNKNTPTDSLPLNYPASYWLWMQQYNQVNTAQKLKQAVLVIQGERDYQVRMTDFNQWKESLSKNKNAQFKSYPGLNHLFQEGPVPSLPSEYVDQKNIPEYVVKDIHDFILKP